MNKFQLSRVFSLLALVSMTCLMPSQAYSIDGGIFELDSNAIVNDPSTHDDWETFNGSNNNNNRTTGIVSDEKPAVFRNGSKDIDDISAWRYDLGSSPPKDDMLHAYAVAYNPDGSTIEIPGANNGDLVVYFGADRVAFNGTASLGFWFFKNPVERNDATKRFVNPITGQPATHANGDTLVAFEYSNGGAVTTVKVFVWQNGTLVDKGSIGTDATTTPGMYCNTASTGVPEDSICGGTNPGNISLPWNGTVSAGQFFEGGINLSKVIGGDACFASFMATSRSSSTATASIKNFIIHSFPVCRVSVTKYCDDPVVNAENNTVGYTIEGKITNDGGGTLQSISLTDDPDDFDTLNYFTCDAEGKPTDISASSSPLVAGAAVCYRGTITSETNGLEDTVTVVASTGSGSVSASADATCPQASVDTSLEVKKSCDMDIVKENDKLVLKVNYYGEVCNYSDVTLSNVKVCETHGVDIPSGQTPCDVSQKTVISIGTLLKDQCEDYTSSYYPEDADDGTLLNPVGDPVKFEDKVGAIGTPPAIFNLEDVQAIPADARCGLCPD